MPPASCSTVPLSPFEGEPLSDDGAPESTPLPPESDPGEPPPSAEVPPASVVAPGPVAVFEELPQARGASAIVTRSTGKAPVDICDLIRRPWPASSPSGAARRDLTASPSLRLGNALKCAT